jgi:cell division transport system permease protein
MALQRMQEKFGPDMLQGLDENPLPASFVLKVDKSIFEPQAAEILVKKLRSYPEVDDVVFAAEILNRLSRIMKSIEIIGLALSCLVALAAIFIVGNTVRLVISDRRKTVEIMQMVGATRSYILMPFVSFGGFIGLTGAAASMAALSWTVRFISGHITNLVFLDPLEIVVFIVAGLVLGMVGAIVATLRYLKI